MVSIADVLNEEEEKQKEIALTILEEEKRKLRIKEEVELSVTEPNYNLPFFKFIEEYWTKWITRISKIDKQYIIFMPKGYLKNPKIIRSKYRHELYHLVKGHVDNPKNNRFLRNIFLDISARLYQHFGIKF